MKLEDVINGTWEIVNGVVNVHGSVNISDKGLIEIPWKFGFVTGGFFCFANNLTSLKNSPIRVNGPFNCCNNKLKSLRYSPSYVGANFFCHNNKIRSLKYCPEIIGGQIRCCDNPIKSFKNVPLSVLMKIKDAEDFSSLIITPIPSEYFDNFTRFMKRNMGLEKVNKKVSYEDRLNNI